MWLDLEGKDIALVGNSTSGLTRGLGSAIDAHGTVIRMNAGAPSPSHYEALGKRTDVLSAATTRCLEASMVELPIETPIWFCKHTHLGDREWSALVDEGKYPHIWRCPREWVDDAFKSVNGRPSQGLVLVMALLGPIKVASVSVFNVDFFGVLGACESWWHGERPGAVLETKMRHDGVKEFKVFEELGFTRKVDGWWTWTRSTGA